MREISGSSLNETPSGERVHIAFFGLRNAGKSSLVNAVTGQDLAVVSDVKGTTTDPVRKAMELLPLGPVVIVDTPGLDDEGALGELRVKRALSVLGNCDVAVLVHDAVEEFSRAEEELVGLIEGRELPYVVAYNKADLLTERGRVGGVAVNGVSGTAFDSAHTSGLSTSVPGTSPDAGLSSNAIDLAHTFGLSTHVTVPSPDARLSSNAIDSAHTSGLSHNVTAPSRDAGLSSNSPLPSHQAATAPRSIFVSALTGQNINELKELIASLAPKKFSAKKLIADLLTPGDVVILVVPVDKAAPKGRLILPQQQAIRDILDSGCSAFVCQVPQLPLALSTLTPRIVITDSQVFGQVNAIVPPDIPLTSFSILFARYKGDLQTLVDGAKKLSSLRDNDKVLISEGCTHHRQCGDIGTEKIPAWIRNFSGSNPHFSFTSGGEFPDSDTLKSYSLIVHCGGCMLNAQEMASRLERAKLAGVPIVNYGIAIAHMHGILERSIEPFA